MQVNSIVQAVLFFCLMGCAAYTDIRKREIPPIIWGSVAIISLLDYQAVHLLGILAAFPLFIIAVWIAPNRLGGGDIKLVAVTGLGAWAASDELWNYHRTYISSTGILHFCTDKKVKETGGKEYFPASCPLFGDWFFNHIFNENWRNHT